jgi:transposase
MSTIGLMDIIAPDERTKRLVPSLQMTGAALPVRGGKRTRRPWSDEEKRRIVAEAMVPGASVAEIARRHGMNANLVFTWRKAARTASSSVPIESNAPTASLQGDASSAAIEPCEFVPIGVFARTEDGEPGFTTTASSSPRPGESAGRPAAATRPTLEERTGLIVIDLADGTRLRVDAFVNERALRRVLTVLKATS